MVPIVLLWMHLLAPRAPAARLYVQAEAIAANLPSRTEAAELTVLSFVETTFGRAGIPFGVSCCRRRGMSLGKTAAWALSILRKARRVCGASLAARMGFYRTGRCRSDGQAELRARLVRRLVGEPDALSER